MNFSRYRYALALCLAAALSLSTPGLNAAPKNKDGKGKGGSSKVVKRSGGDRGPQRTASVRRGDRPRQNIARSQPRSADRIARAPSVRRSDDRPKVNRQKSRVIPPSQLASRSMSRDRDRDRALRTSRVQRDNDRRVAVQRDDDRRVSVQRRDRDHDRRDRDRSRYTRRHDHHNHSWFITNGWWYDRDYWHSHHVHRYYNDTLGVYIINPTGPSYGDGYSDYYGFDYETRIAVQQTLAELGYYYGAIDGVIGPGTRSAIARYQSDYGLAVTGEINTSLMQSMRLM